MKRRALLIGLLLLPAFIWVLIYAWALWGCAKMYERRLAQCNRSPVETAFACPNGELYQILLGVPKSHDPPSFAGRMQVTDQESNEVVCDFEFTGGGEQGCNWLDAYDLNGYILTWGREKMQNIQPKHNYRVTVRFSKSPPPDASLWLVWVN